MKVIIFDTETNGFRNSSVLSIAAIIVEFVSNDLIEIGRFERYYFPNKGEYFNKHAAKVHGLSIKSIEELRNSNDYPQCFKDDAKSFYEFCSDANGFIAHNLRFDESFIPFPLWGKFCSLDAWGGKLSVLAQEKGILLDEGALHNAMYDTEILFEVIRTFHLESNPILIDYTSSNRETQADKETIETLFQASAKNEPQTISFDYTNNRGESSHRELAQFEIVCVENLWVCRGKEAGRKRLKTFRLDKMNNIVGDLSITDTQIKQYILKNTSSEPVKKHKESRSAALPKASTKITCPDIARSILDALNEIMHDDELVGLSILLRNINALLPMPIGIAVNGLNQYMVDKGVLSKDGRKTIVNETSETVGIKCIKNEGEDFFRIVFTANGKRYVTECLKAIIEEEIESLVVAE